MPRKLPFLQYYVDDHLNDEKLSQCSLAAQGLWMRLLCRMHKNPRRGFLQQATGKAFTLEQIAGIAGRSSGEVSPLLQELIECQVASVSDHGILYSKRMVRDEHTRQVRSKAGRKGGKVTGGLLKQNAKQTSSKPSSKPSDYENIGMSLDPPSEETKRGDPGGFEKFWQAYPRKTAKQTARKSWERIRPDDALLGAMLVAIERQGKTDQWRRGIIPHPATWLNQHRWEDEPHEAPPTHKNGSLFAGIDAFARGGPFNDAG